MRRIVSTIVGQCISRGIINEDDKDIHIYGGTYLSYFLFNIVFPVALGVMGGVFIEMVGFVIGYCMLRRFTGGFHAKTPTLCFVLSQLMILFVYVVIKNSQYIPPVLLLIMSGLSIILIASLSPMETKSRPLDDAQRKEFRTKAIWLSLILMCIALGFMSVSYSISVAIALVCVNVAFLMVQGLVVNKQKELNQYN